MLRLPTLELVKGTFNDIKPFSATHKGISVGNKLATKTASEKKRKERERIEGSPSPSLSNLGGCT